MKARDLIGKKIVAVRQERFRNRDKWIYHFQGFELEDGTIFYASAIETEGDYAIEGHVFKHKKRAS